MLFAALLSLSYTQAFHEKLMWCSLRQESLLSVRFSDMIKPITVVLTLVCNSSCSVFTMNMNDASQTHTEGGTEDHTHWTHCTLQRKKQLRNHIDTS